MFELFLNAKVWKSISTDLTRWSPGVEVQDYKRGRVELANGHVVAKLSTDDDAWSRNISLKSVNMKERIRKQEKSENR